MKILIFEDLGVNSEERVRGGRGKCIFLEGGVFEVFFWSK